MKTSKLVSIITVVIAVVVTAGACKSSTPSGRIAVGIKDGPPTASDGRIISALEIDITRIELEPDGVNATSNTEDGGDSQNNDVVVFDAGSGAPRTIDLLKVTTFSALVANAAVPAGQYGGATVVVSGARAVFSDDPSNAKVALVLEGDGRSKAEFDFKFKPHAKVAEGGSTMAVIDFVPKVNKDAMGKYWLSHDGDNDESGEVEKGGEVEVTGVIATVTSNTFTIGPSPLVTVDFSAAEITRSEATASKSDLAPGQKVEAEGRLDPATGTIAANEIHIKKQ
jgi:hypothetical protein